MKIIVRSKVTSRGRITLPKEVREQLGLRPGDEVEFVEREGGLQIRKRVPRYALDKWVGYLKHLEGQDVDELIREMRDPW